MAENELYIDIAYKSLNKKKEELCGDKVEVFKSKERTIIVLADGLGSGVKANILATLTSKIAITMLKKGACIEEVIDTIIHTLPVCKVRKMAYSTFSILEINQNLQCQIFESENPPFFFLRNNVVMTPEKVVKEYHGKKIQISEFQLEEEDIIYLVSDGVIHAGVGKTLNYGWEWPNVADYLEGTRASNAHDLSQSLIDACNDLYQEAPGDDTTVVTLKLRKPLEVLLFTGPPLQKSLDNPFVKNFVAKNGKKIVCGGTAANIVAKVLEKPIKTSLNYVDKTLPPIATIDGIDLVTEGVLTLKRLIEIIECWQQAPHSVDLTKEDGATKLFHLMVEESTHINIWLGKAMNEAHQRPDFPLELSMKVNVVKELIDVLRDIGKEVSLKYISEVAYENI